MSVSQWLLKNTVTLRTTNMATTDTTIHRPQLSLENTARGKMKCRGHRPNCGGGIELTPKIAGGETT